MFPCPAPCENNYTQDNRRKTPNLPFLGNEPAYLIPNAITNLTTICWDLQALDHVGSNACCPPQAGTMTLTPRGGATYPVPSGQELKGCFQIPVQLTDAQDIIMQYLDCNGDSQTIVAGTNFIGFNCDPQSVTLLKLCTNYVLHSCPLCTCDCGFPFNVSVTLPNSQPVVIGQIDRRGALVITDNNYKDKNGVYVRGYYQATGSACNGTARVFIGFNPGLPEGTIVTATIQNNIYSFTCGIEAPFSNFCGGPVDIAGVCIDGGTGGGGNSNLPITITGINGTTVTEGPAGNFVVDSNALQTAINNEVIVNNNQQIAINTHTAQITAINNELLADQDFQQISAVANWVNDTLNPATMWMLVVNHNDNAPVGAENQVSVVDSSGTPTSYQIRYVNGNTLNLITTKIPDGRLDVTVNVEHFEINNPL